MTMRFYTGPHRCYCGVDLHTRTLSLCVLDADGAIVLEATLPPEPDRLLAALAPFRDGLVVGCECLFAWYWLADLCAAEGIPFVLGHALYLKAIHGGKTKTDTIDARKLARLLRGGNFAEAYVYPTAMRATRDLLRRRTHIPRALTPRSPGPLTDALLAVQPHPAGAKARLRRQPRRTRPRRLPRPQHPLDARRRPGRRHGAQSADQTPRSGVGPLRQDPRPASVPPAADRARHRPGAGADPALRGARHPPLRRRRPVPLLRPTGQRRPRERR